MEQKKQSKITTLREKQLETVRALEILGHPEKGMRIVHIAGTNGKGSVGALLSRGLVEVGQRVGHFSSPHVLHYNERIRVDGEEIADDALDALRERISAEVRTELTYFQESFFVALLYFKERGVDTAIIECGIGGQEDITNVIDSDLQVITQISMDHMKRLGYTLREIATHKAGIFEPGGLAVSCDQSPEAADALRKVADDRNTTLYFVAGDSYAFDEIGRTEKGENSECSESGEVSEKSEKPSALVTKFTFVERDWEVSLLGKHQAQNTALAIAALGMLGISDLDAMQRAFLKAQWIGRLEKICEDPEIWIDGAHNDSAVQMLLDNLKALGLRPKSLIFGMHAEKISEESQEALYECAENVYFIPVDQTEDEVILASVWSALEQAEGPILVTGSLYSLGAAIQWAKANGTAK